MVKTVFSIGLSTGEKLTIKKNRLEGTALSGQNKRVAIVSGTHGDELEGQYVCYEVIRRIKEHPEYLCGVVDIYPALNPLGIAVADRMVPRLELDMNRMFPGDEKGTPMERVTAAIIQDLAGADLCIDVHASNEFLKEIPQVRISEEFAEKLLPYAKHMNADMVWMNATATVHESTLAHSMNMLGVPTLVVEMGLGMRVNRNFGSQVVDGIFNLLYEMGLWSKKPRNIQFPVLSTDGEVEFIRAQCDGVFLPAIEHNHFIKMGDVIGEIINPIEGTVKQEIVAVKDGLVFTLREYPIVNEGSLIARILTDIQIGSRESDWEKSKGEEECS